MADRQRPGTGYKVRFEANVRVTKRRPKLKFFIILGAVLALTAIVLVLVLRPQPTAAIEIAKTDYQATFDMLIVRDEVVYEAKNYGKTNFVAVEGQRVRPGDLIVEVYEWGYNDQTLSDLLDVQAKILAYESDVIKADIIDEQLIDINTRIEGKASQIQVAVSEERSKDMLGLEREMQELLDERSRYLRNVMPDVALRALLKQEKVLIDTIEEWRSEVIASESGLVSFYFDGCESLMAKDNIGSFTKKSLQEVYMGKTVETPFDDQASSPLYRVVDENEWYVVMYAEEHIPEMFVGNGYALRFEDYFDTQYAGVVVDVSKLEKNDGFVYTIRLEDDIGPLLGKRRVSVEVYNELEGMRVPASCVKPADETDYVETVDGEIVPVMVIADDGEHLFIQTYTDGPQLEIGQILKK